MGNMGKYKYHQCEKNKTHLSGGGSMHIKDLGPLATSTY